LAKGKKGKEEKGIRLIRILFFSGSVWRRAEEKRRYTHQKGDREEDGDNYRC
jgi:hypothetical protein